MAPQLAAQPVKPKRKRTDVEPEGAMKDIAQEPILRPTEGSTKEKDPTTFLTKKPRKINEPTLPQSLSSVVRTLDFRASLDEAY